MATFTLAPDGGTAAHAPGQYFALGLAIDGQPVLRPYSAASEAGSATLQFVIRLVPDGALTPALWRLGIGDRLWIGPPKGLFRLVDDDPRTHLLIGTGTGIAPLVAMARALRRRTAPPATVVVHGASRVDELAFRGDLEHWASAAPWLQYAPSVSRPDEPVNDGWRGRTGRLDAAIPALLADLDVEPRTAVAYVCGNPAMIEALRGLLPRLGVPASSIRSESF
jgi:ferredoxin--NADP+ reductase